MAPKFVLIELLYNLYSSFSLLCSFDLWKVKHLKRNYNKAAHELAQIAKTTRTTQQWKGMEPPMLQQVLLIDKAKC